MQETRTTPGVYIQETNNTPHTIVPAPTAVPVFIGYTATASYEGKNVLRTPVRIASLAAYTAVFGGGYRPVFTIAPATDGALPVATVMANNTAYLYNSLRLYFDNGGGPCYILSVGTYGTTPGSCTMRMEDYTGNGTQPSAWQILEQAVEPTLVLLPDAHVLGATNAYMLYQQALAHCNIMMNRMVIMDVSQSTAGSPMDSTVTDFRTGVGINFLNYGAAYFPWLVTTLVQESDIDLRNIDAAVPLAQLLPEPAAQDILTQYAAQKDKTAADEQRYSNMLRAASPTYVAICNELLAVCNTLPPAAAMAGVYNVVDNTRGVWAAPANVSLASVAAPSLLLTEEEQAVLSVAATGKSINAIRMFPGQGVLVWGARTLDGNSQDWRYVAVRRTVMLLETSIKQGMQSFIFEPNTATTWAAMQAMVSAFLNDLWQCGALAGPSPKDAYSVSIGLGSTMTAADILAGLVHMTVLVALTHPAEFIVLNFEQQMQG